MASPALAPACPNLSCAEDTRAGHCTAFQVGSQRAERRDRIISLTPLAVPPSLQHSQPHLINTPGASQHTGPVTPAAAPTACIHIWHRETSAFSPTLTVTSRKQIQQCLYQASHNPLPPGEGQTHRFETCPDSSHFYVTRVTITLSITQPLQHSGCQAACFMPGWSHIYTPTGHTASYWKKMEH